MLDPRSVDEKRAAAYRCRDRLEELGRSCAGCHLSCYCGELSRVQSARQWASAASGALAVLKSTIVAEAGRPSPLGARVSELEAMVEQVQVGLADLRGEVLGG